MINAARVSLWAVGWTVRLGWRVVRSVAEDVWRIARLAAMALAAVMVVLVVFDVPGERRLVRRVLDSARALDLVVAPIPVPLEGAPPIVWHVGSARVSSGFGSLLNPVTGRLHQHLGVDLSVPTGTPVHAGRAGVVSRATEDALNGVYVVVETPDGLRFAYCHLDRADVAKGESVRASQPIGVSGNTGRSTGPHLHFGTWWHGRAVDPLRLRRIESVAQR